MRRCPVTEDRQTMPPSSMYSAFEVRQEAQRTGREMFHPREQQSFLKTRSSGSQEKSKEVGALCAGSNSLDCGHQLCQASKTWASVCVWWDHRKHLHLDYRLGDVSVLEVRVGTRNPLVKPFSPSLQVQRCVLLHL